MKTFRRLTTLVLVLALAGGIAYGVSRATRSHVAGRLADRILADEQNPAAMMAELAKLDLDAIVPLARAAASPQRRLATPAQRQIERMLEDWWLESKRSATFDLETRLTKLTGELLANADRLSPAGQYWSANAARKVLRLSAEVAPGQWPQVIVSCDKVLAATRKHTDVPDIEVADNDVANTAAIANGGVLRPRTAPQTQSPITIQPEPSTFTDETEIATGPPLPTVPPLEFAIAPKVADDTLIELAPAPMQQSQPMEVAEQQPQPIEQPAEPALLDTSKKHLAWDQPNQATAKKNPARPNTSAGPGEPAPPAESLDSLSDLELLRRYLQVNLTSLAPVDGEPTPGDRLRQAVIDRGYGGVARQHVQRLLSPQETIRRQLVGQLIAARTEGATRLIMILAQDTSGRVRAEAVAALGSSPDRRLVELAWQLAIKDRDPQVARLAGKLQARRR